jgi:23S rRNA (pseudouridine1915-N3)-methyltransferase
VKIKIIAIGKTSKKFLEEGEQEYLKRLKHYIPLEMSVIPDIKNAKSKSFEQIKEEEGRMILDKLKPVE